VFFCGECQHCSEAKDKRRQNLSTLSTVHSLGTLSVSVVNQPKAIIASCYHVVFTTNTRVDRIAIRLEGKTDKHAEGGSVPARLIRGGCRSMELFVVTSV